MNIVLLGAPGAGKGTQAALISERFSLPHISTGDMFRYNIKHQTPIGVVAKSYIDKGQLVPDEVTVEIVKQKLAEDDCKNGYLLDGFPRNIFQADALQGFSEVDAVLNIDIPFERLMGRLTGRRVCSSCGESYHVSNLNGSTVCHKCGGELIQRADDNEKTVSDRLKVYSSQTEPLIDYYKAKGKLLTVDGDRSVEEIFDDICVLLSK